MEIGTTALETEIAAPDDDPPGARLPPSSAALVGVPKWGFSPSPEYASSLKFVFPMLIIPARSAASTIAALWAAGALSRKTSAPAVVVSPLTSKRSFHAIGTPSRALSGLPCSQRLADAFADCSARSASRE